MTKTVPIAEIKIDAGTQVRVKIQDPTVAEYAAAMQAGAIFPPIILYHDGSQYSVGDGFHRVLAATRINRTEIAAEIRIGTPEDALWYALGANSRNGLRLKSEDKKHAILLALKTWPDKSTRELAEQIGCHHAWVARIKDQVSTSRHLPDRVTGKDGKSYPAAKENRTTAERVEAVRALSKQGLTCEQMAADLGLSINRVRQLARMAGVIPTKKYMTQAARIEVIREMAAQGFHSRQIAPKIGVEHEHVRLLAKKAGIKMPDVRSRRIDANRVVGETVNAAEALTAGLELIDGHFDELDAGRLDDWIARLQYAVKALNGLVGKLRRSKDVEQNSREIRQEN